MPRLKALFEHYWQKVIPSICHCEEGVAPVRAKTADAAISTLMKHEIATTPSPALRDSGSRNDNKKEKVKS